MTLKFSKAMLLASLSVFVVIGSAVMLYHSFWSYIFGRVNLIPLLGFSVLILWGVVNITGCFLYDRSISRGLVAHHKEALAFDEGRPSDQP